MQMRPCGPSGGAGEGDHVPGLDCPANSGDELGAVAVERDQPAAVIDAHIITVVAPVVGGDGDGPRQGGPDGRAGGDRQVHAAVALRLSGEGVLAVAELRGDDVPPVRSDGRAEAVRADEGRFNL